MPFKLSDRQQTTVASAVTILAVLVILAAVSGLVVLIAVFLRTFSHVFLPLAVAAVAALVFRPYYVWLGERLRLPPVLALVVVFLSGLVPVAVFLGIFGPLVVDQVSELIGKVPEWWKQGVDYVEKHLPQVVEFLDQNPIGQRLRSAAEGQQDTLLEGIKGVGGTALSVGASVLRGVGVALSWAVLPVYFAFFLMAKHPQVGELDSLLPFLKPDTRNNVVYLAREFVNIVVAFFRGQLIIALLQGLLFAIGFSLVGLSYGFVLGLMLGFLNVIPYLGSIVGLSVALPLAFFPRGEDSFWNVLWVLVVFAVVQLIEGYVLTPKIMGERTGLHPMAIIVAVFFWGTALGGIMGMILAIPLTAFLVVFWRLAREKYIRELV